MTTEKIEHISNVTANIGAGITGIAWLWNWLGINHDAITAVCALIGMAIAVIGFIINITAKRKRK